MGSPPATSSVEVYIRGCRLSSLASLVRPAGTHGYSKVSLTAETIATTCGVVYIRGCRPSSLARPAGTHGYSKVSLTVEATAGWQGLVRIQE